MSIKYIKNIDEKTPIDILIPAAGLGKRMKSYGPKPLIKIKKNFSILENQIKIFQKLLPNSTIIIVCGFQSEILMDRCPEGIIKIENERYEETNVVRSLGMGLRACTKDVLICYGDLVFNEECIENMNLNKSSVFTGKDIMKDGEVGCIVNSKGKIENMMYDLDNKWGQILFLKGKELKMFKEACWNPENYNMFGFEAINKVIEQGGDIIACSNEKAKVIDIDSSKDLEKVSNIL